MNAKLVRIMAIQDQAHQDLDFWWFGATEEFKNSIDTLLCLSPMEFVQRLIVLDDPNVVLFMQKAVLTVLGDANIRCCPEALEAIE